MTSTRAVEVDEGGGTQAEPLGGGRIAVVVVFVVLPVLLIVLISLLGTAASSDIFARRVVAGLSDEAAGGRR